jgi:hypothetical protein
MTDIPEIEQAKLDFINFRGNKNPTDDDLIAQILDGKGIYPVKAIEKDGKLFKERGCRFECACTGMCHELVPYTDLDALCHRHYANIRSILHTELYRQHKEEG